MVLVMVMAMVVVVMMMMTMNGIATAVFFVINAMRKNCILGPCPMQEVTNERSIQQRITGVTNGVAKHVAPCGSETEK